MQKAQSHLGPVHNITLLKLWHYVLEFNSIKNIYDELRSKTNTITAFDNQKDTPNKCATAGHF